MNREPSSAKAPWPRYWPLLLPLAYLVHLAEEAWGGGGLARWASTALSAPASDDPAALDVAEFFVLRSHRGAGVGRGAAFRLWDRMPASWVVRVAETNLAAIPFWHRAVNDYTRGAFTTHQHRGEHALFRVYRFRTADRAASQSGPL